MQTANELLTVETPEFVGFQYPLAGVGSRALAFLLDTAVRGLFIFCLFIVTILILNWIPRLPLLDFLAELSKTWIIGIGFLLYGLVDLGYFIIFEALWSGQTPGKRQQRLRVIRTNGQSIGWIDSAIRNILRALDLLAGLYPLGLIVMFLSPRNRRIGDYAAGTVVIVERKQDVPGKSTSVEGGLSETAAMIGPHVATLTPGQYQLLRRFIQRRDGMDRNSRHDLARTLAHRLMDRWGMSPPADTTYETFIEMIVDTYEQNRRAI